MSQQFLESGGSASLDDAEDEIDVGYAAWKLPGGVQAGVSSAEEWQRFSAPGYVKAVMGFRAELANGPRCSDSRRVCSRPTRPRGVVSFATGG